MLIDLTYIQNISVKRIQFDTVLAQAFDCLPHNLLLLKLENYGVSENSLKLLQSYLTGRKQCIKIVLSSA
jgi:hypothetical protein